MTTDYGSFCQSCERPYQEDGYQRRSWSFGVVCAECSDRAGRTIQRQNKRCRKKNYSNRLTRFDWLAVLYKHDFRCADCKQKKELTLDHKVKLCEGGSNGWWNIQPLCVPCHRKKDDGIAV